MTIREYFREHLKELETAPGTRGTAYTVWADGKPIGNGTFEQLMPDYGDKEIIEINGKRIDVKW